MIGRKKRRPALASAPDSRSTLLEALISRYVAAGVVPRRIGDARSPWHVIELGRTPKGTVSAGSALACLTRANPNTTEHIIGTLRDAHRWLMIQYTRGSLVRVHPTTLMGQVLEAYLRASASLEASDSAFEAAAQRVRADAFEADRGKALVALMRAGETESARFLKVARAVNHDELEAA